MKTFLRTLAILVAALVVVGGMLAFGQSSYAGSMRAQGPGREHSEREAEGFFGADSGEGFFTNPGERGARPPMGRGFERGGEHGGRGGFNIFGAAEAIKNLVIMAVIVALVVAGERLLGLGRPRARRA